MVSTVYFFLCQLLQFSFNNCFVLENLRQAGGYAESPLLRNTNPATLYITRALLALLIFLEVSN